jgi:hypothetical protein
MPAERVVDEDEIRESVCLTGDVANSIGKILYELYITRLTATRAAYLEELNAAALAQGAGSVASNAQVDSLVRAVADIVRSGGSGDLAAILADVTGINGSAMLTAANVWQTNISAYSGAGYAGTYLKTLYDDWLNGGRLDLILDSINDGTKLQFAAAGSKTIAASAEKYLSFDSGTDGAEIVSITVKGVVGADWTIETYIPVVDAVAAPAAGDKRDEDVYVNTDDKGGQMSNIGAIRYNMFLDITNDSAGSDDIDEVIVTYRSAGTLSLAWEV